MKLELLYTLASTLKSYGEFKAAVDYKMNGTPQTVENDSEYMLIKISPNICISCGIETNNGGSLCDVCCCRGLDSYQQACISFVPHKNITSATKCINCGKEKQEHQQPLTP